MKLKNKMTHKFCSRVSSVVILWEMRWSNAELLVPNWGIIGKCPECALQVNSTQDYSIGDIIMQIFGILFTSVFITKWYNECLLFLIQSQYFNNCKAWWQGQLFTVALIKHMKVCRLQSSDGSDCSEVVQCIVATAAHRPLPLLTSPQ